MRTTYENGVRKKAKSEKEWREEAKAAAVAAQKLLLMTAMLQYKTIHFTSPRNTHTKSLLMFHHR